LKIVRPHAFPAFPLQKTAAVIAQAFPSLDDPKVLALFDRYARGIKALSFLDRHLL